MLEHILLGLLLILGIVALSVLGGLIAGCIMGQKPEIKELVKALKDEKNSARTMKVSKRGGLTK